MVLIFCFYYQDANHIHVTLFRLTNVNTIVPFRWIELQELRFLMKLEQLVYVLWVNTTTAQVSRIINSSYTTPLPTIGVSYLAFTQEARVRFPLLIISHRCTVLDGDLTKNCGDQLEWLKRLGMQGSDPHTSRMLSERSTTM
ncbi:hypothetical protein OUZ56_025980 [Daphnia magna]|uniref:Uncharacterized protein n=1 Tax=Daphnia magna TaxID=35525 RepID=A0ABQ9ZKH3_9CRUS|nr:hypothetical protein OUZ56_025980 [Daphnia magna]